MRGSLSAARRSGCVPVSASTNVDLSWSMCPAVPTMTLFIAVDIFEWAEILLPLWMLLEERIGGHTPVLLRGGDFVPDGLLGGTRIGPGKNRPAPDHVIASVSNPFLHRTFPCPSII